MAIVEKVRVWNYRSISDSGWIPIKDDFSTLIGPNGAGKSNFLNALTRFSDNSEISISNLCQYRDDFPPAESTAIPIVSFIFTDLSISSAPFTQEPLTLSDLELFSDPDDTIAYEVSKKISPDNVLITRFRDGSSRIYLGDSYEANTESKLISNSIKVSDFIYQRRDDLIRMSTKLIEELDIQYGKVVHSIDGQEITEPSSFLQTPKDHIDYLSELSSLIELEELEYEYADSKDEEGTLDTGSEEDSLDFRTIQKEIDDLGNRLVEVQNIRNSPLDKLPTIFPNTKIEPIPDRVEFNRISEIASYQGLLDASNVDPDRLYSVDREHLLEQIKQGSERLSQLFNTYWELDTRNSLEAFPSEAQSNKYEITADIGESSVALYLKDDSETKLPVNDRSMGERWILSFLLKVIYTVGDDDRNGLVILDDPGVHLHPSAQELLLNSISRLSSSKQVIYCTHSPFLIDNGRLDSISAVEHTIESGTKIQTNLGEIRSKQNMESLAPIRDSLGAEIAMFPFGSTANILVEGYSDKMYLQELNNLLNNSETEDGISDQIGLIDVEGTKASYMSKFLQSQGLDHIILLDDDADSTKEGLVDSGIEADRIYYLGDFNCTPSGGNAIEDLLPTRLLCEVVADMQKEELDYNILLEAIGEDDQAINSISYELHKLVEDGQLSEKVLNKGDIADEVTVRLRRQARKGEVDEELYNIFEHLLQEIRSKLEMSDLENIPESES